MDSGKTDDCFVMRPRSSVQTTQLQLQLLRFRLCVYICIFIHVALIRPTV